MAIRIAVHGAGGRMGRRVVALGAQNPRLQIAAALEHPAHPDLGKDAGTLAGIEPIGVPLSDTWPDDLDAVIDFSSPAGCQAAID
ncbi:MAG: 4-hydroxy-tetrahydrodipicolinate reductase, partial [Planctomycetota bacterium]